MGSGFHRSDEYTATGPIDAFDKDSLEIPQPGGDGVQHSNDSGREIVGFLRHYAYYPQNLATGVNWQADHRLETLGHHTGVGVWVVGIVISHWYWRC